MMTRRSAAPLLAVVAALAAATVAAGCGTPSLPSSTAARPEAIDTPATTVAATPLPTPAPVSDQVAVVRSTVTAGDPRLLPSYIPAGMTAQVRASAASYTVVYTDDQHTRTITLSVNEGVNPPPARTNFNPNGTGTSITFRGVTTSYVVYDTTAPLSQRHLLWQEPGNWSGKVTSMSGIEYFLGATGLTESEFFRVANSLQPVH
jgi:hypothetical protein